jgi:hypothetical protein
LQNFVIASIHNHLGTRKECPDDVMRTSLGEVWASDKPRVLFTHKR